MSEPMLVLSTVAVLVIALVVAAVALMWGTMRQVRKTIREGQRHG